MTKILAAVCLVLLARPQFFALEPKPIDFCADGKFLVFTGNCALPKGAPFTDSISRKACGEVKSDLVAGLYRLYPYSKVYVYADLEPDAVYDKLTAPGTKGFFLVGEGDVKGGLVSGKARAAVYPSAGACQDSPDVFGGFFSHSKYSPDNAAPKELRGRVLARMEYAESPVNAVKGSWPDVCAPKAALVYPTRTFAGRMKDDVKRLLRALTERKKEQAQKALEEICGACGQYVKAGYPLAKLCPPNSDVCRLKRLTPGYENLVLDNYCLLYHPE